MRHRVYEAFLCLVVGQAVGHVGHFATYSSDTSDKAFLTAWKLLMGVDIAIPLHHKIFAIWKKYE